MTTKQYPNQNPNTFSQKPLVIFLMGPTASGKTDLAIEFCARYPVEIISVDSAMIYRGMNIGTGKPNANELVQAPHHLINIRDPKESYSAAEFCQDALHCIQDITSRHKIPLLVGGTSLYFHALEHGLSELPSQDIAIREKILNQAKEMGWDKMHDYLKKIDPKAAHAIHPNDPQRISRALEVYEITGKPMSLLWEMKSPLWEAEMQKYHLVKFALVPHNRKVLHDRIHARFHKMLEQGFVEEVMQLYNRGDLHPALPSIRAVGYRQIWQYLENKNKTNTFLVEMTEKALCATRQLAKRQLTWLRNTHRMPSSKNVNVENNITILEMENSYLDSLQTMVHCSFHKPGVKVF